MIEIPKVCPICKNPSDKLVIHHWGNSHKGDAIHNGFYRRMCRSCNISLGMVFRGDYPQSWDSQLEALHKWIGRYTKESYPNFDGNEEWWSRLSEEEMGKILPSRVSLPRENNTYPRLRKLLDRLLRVAAESEDWILQKAFMPKIIALKFLVSELEKKERSGRESVTVKE